MIDAVRGPLAVYARSPAILRWSLAGAWAAAIWWSSTRSGSGEPISRAWVVVHNSAHVFLFGALTALITFALGVGVARRHVQAILVASFYGLIDEWHQGSIPGRDANPWDVVADVSGAALFGGALLWLWTPQVRWARSVTTAAVPVAIAAVALASF